MTMTLFFSVMCGVGYSATCHFNTPTINTDVCQTLNLNNKVEDNPYFLKNSNGLCGVNFQLSGLPDFSLKDYLPNFNVADACKYLHYLSGDDVVNKIKSFLN